jgi:hypothetical protein
MTDELESILVAEIGSVTTRVVLVDVVEGEYRMIGQAEKPGSIEPPFQNATIAILEATAQIAETTGRKLLREGQLLMPQTSERDGISSVVATTSAAGNLSLVIVAIASDISARSALNGCRSTYTSVLQVITLDDQEKQQAASFLSIPPSRTNQRQRRTASHSASWVERQVETMLALNPDAALLAGGLEGGTTDTLRRLAHIVALTTFRTSVDTRGQQYQDTTRYTVIYAGNTTARDDVRAILNDRAETIVVDNVRPSLEQERLEPMRQAIDQLYQERILPRLPGYAVLNDLCHPPITTVAQSTGLMTRFFAKRQQRQVLTLDVGSTSSSAFLAGPTYYQPVVRGTCGVGYGITTILAERGLRAIARWLPFHLDEKDLLHWLLNKMMRPHVIPSSREDVLIEHAVAREALGLVLETLDTENIQYDLVIAAGGVLAHAPHPGLTALTLLDALQPTAERSERAIDLHLDLLGLLPACGALATMKPDATATLADRDFYQNMPLATCIIPLGEHRPGKIALEAELTTTSGKMYQAQVQHGQITRLPLEPGTRGQLTLRPAAGVRIGRNAPGAEVKSDIAAVGGSALGVIIDARGRPLPLKEDARQRCEQLWSWLVSLGIEQGPSPYVDSVPDEAARPSVVLEEFLPGESTLSPDEIMGESAETDGQEAVSPPAKQPPAPKPRQEQPPQPGQESPPPSQKPQPQPAAPAPEPQPEVGGQAGSGKRISLADLMNEEQQEPTRQPDKPEKPAKPAKPVKPSESHPAPGSLDSDLASLRETVGKPEKKKRGLFGKKK